MSEREGEKFEEKTSLKVEAEEAAVIQGEESPSEDQV
jgi:hypothetical protein